MTTPSIDRRSDARRALDEQIAAEPQVPHPDLPADEGALPVEAHLAGLHPRPYALTGVVENGVVRLLDPTVRLPEGARVIVVASEERT